MNNNIYYSEKINKNNTLIIVEGHKEKEIFKLIFKCFPEMNIDFSNVFIYGTNIYVLYNMIKKEYGDDWENIDIDLPFLLREKLPQYKNIKFYKKYFSNIFLIFDYERQDPNFSVKTIIKMQKYFYNETDFGKLYINYPMLESYMHFRTLPDKDYEFECISSKIEICSKYKQLFNKDGIFYKFLHKKFNFLNILNKQITKIFNITDNIMIDNIISDLISIKSYEQLDNYIKCDLSLKVQENNLSQLKYIKKLVDDVGYIQQNNTYYDFMRNILKEIIYHNICKANKLLTGKYIIDKSNYKHTFESIDFNKILEIQNNSDYIWILNTFLFIIADYNFKLIELD